MRNKAVLILRGLLERFTPDFLRGGPEEASSKKASIDERVTETFVHSQIANAAAFNAIISPEDEMHLHALDAYQGDQNRAQLCYLSQGRQMLEEITQIVDWAFGGWSSVSSFLDFACGHGRFSRYLVCELPPEKIWACDIYPDAIRFQEEQFKVHGIESAMNPSDFQTDQRFDIIWVASLFSHLPRETFGQWLSRLHGLLSDDGILIFSTLGMDQRSSAISADADGMAFVHESESRSLDTKDYGTSFVSESFVAKVIEESIEMRMPYRYIPHGLLGFQDLFILPSRNSHRDLTSLDYSRGVFGHYTGCRRKPDGFGISGWAVDLSENDSLEGIQILVNGVLSQTVQPSYDRPDVAQACGTTKALHSGWFCTLPETEVCPEDWVVVKLVTSNGKEHVIGLDSLENMLLYPI